MSVLADPINTEAKMKSSGGAAFLTLLPDTAPQTSPRAP